MVIAEQKRLLNADEFFNQYSSKDGHYELVRGEVVQMPPVNWEHGKRALRVGRILDIFVQQERLGEVSVEAGFVLARNPDVVRGPDVAFMRRERIPAAGWPKGFVPGPPDLAVEVVSPNDTASEIEAKVYEYLQAGTRRVWVVYPDSRRLHVYFPDGICCVLAEADTLTDEELLPGFALPIQEVFAA